MFEAVILVPKQKVRIFEILKNQFLIYIKKLHLQKSLSLYHIQCNVYMYPQDYASSRSELTTISDNSNNVHKHLKNTELYSLEFLRTEMTSDLSN